MGYMKIKEAKALTGGLTYTTKMPGPSYNTPASRCITGAKLRNVKNSVCSSCYALKGNYKRFPKVEEALERRIQSLKHQASSLKRLRQYVTLTNIKKPQ